MLEEPLAHYNPARILDYFPGEVSFSIGGDANPM